jgi:hypothetical protein
VNKKRKKIAKLPVIEPNAAGIDIGATQIFVAVPPDRDTESVRCFATFTVDLEKLADWLEACGIRTAAMESTGVYWIPLFQILEKRKIKPVSVNAQHLNNVPGRKKTDVEDCQWIQHLRAVGLLRGSFRPDDEICKLRSLWRHRDSLIQLATVHLQHMQKALDQMNLQIHHVISDLSGVTGLAIIDAILAGERDPSKLEPRAIYHERRSDTWDNGDTSSCCTRCCDGHNGGFDRDVRPAPRCDSARWRAALCGAVCESNAGCSR